MHDDPLRFLAAPDLDREAMDAMSDLRPDTGPKISLQRWDITDRAAFNCGGIGLARVKTLGRIYEPRPDGFFVLLLSLWSPHEPGINCQEFGDTELVDLLAFDPRQPARWWYRLGEHGHIIGEHQMASGPCIVHPHPLSWLQSECSGCVNLGALDLRAAA